MQATLIPAHALSYLLLLCVQRENVLRVFTFGSPPILEIEATSNLKQIALEGREQCSILDAFELPTDIVYAFNQPWDPIIRLFTQYDPLYPLLDDLGESHVFSMHDS